MRTRGESELDADTASLCWAGADRGTDRDGLLRGWELLPAVVRESPSESEVLNPHYLLQDYGLRHGDVVYAVIARR